MDTSSSHENRSEIEHEKQEKEYSGGNSTEFQSSYLTHEMVFKRKTCSNIKRNYYSNVSQRLAI